MAGLKYPLEIVNGGLRVSKDYPSLVLSAILSSVNTRTEERVMRPEYGREDEEFQSVSSLVDTLGNLRQTITLGLEGYPDVTFELSGSISEGGLVEATVAYQCPDGLERTVEVSLGA